MACIESIHFLIEEKVLLNIFFLTVFVGHPAALWIPELSD